MNMEEHEQVEVKIEDDFIILVDKGMEDIVKNFFHWEIETCNSCIDYKGSVWIEFCDFEEWKKFLQLALRNNIEINGTDHIKDTLWDFLQEKVNVKLVYDEELMEDPNNEDEVLGTGVLVICVGLTFPLELLDEFKKLFFEVLKPE
jgi:hypothetical protein